MKAVLLALLLLVPAAAQAGDPAPAFFSSPPPVVYVPGNPLQNPQARSVMVMRECWRSCERTCAVEFLRCGYQLPGAQCLPLTDACDRACQRQCRPVGGPLVSFD